LHQSYQASIKNNIVLESSFETGWDRDYCIAKTFANADYNNLPASHPVLEGQVHQQS
jgi:hypothetical protein